MKRRDLIRMLAAAAGAALFGIATPAVAAAHRLRRAPRDIVARIRRHTRQVDPSSLHTPHDLAG
ncbi:hypothetical protein ACFL6C_01645 [Myxococcota bacterium]